MESSFQASPHHPYRIMDIFLIVYLILLREDMDYLLARVAILTAHHTMTESIQVLRGNHLISILSCDIVRSFVTLDMLSSYTYIGLRDYYPCFGLC